MTRDYSGRGAVSVTRPRFHFTAPRNWINDPNGLVYVEGVYHLFYQHNPFANEFGPMHWGHATSRDLVTWEHHPIALAPDELGLIFSGSAVIDHENTAGFGAGAIVAVFTHHLEAGVESQSIAFSTDGGYSFNKYPGNPVLRQPEDTPDFRDPKVFWWQEGDEGHWVMVLAVGLSISLYVSDDLISWRPASRFVPDDDSVDSWECPDLAEIPVEGTDERKWVMTVGVTANDLTGTRYWIGDFDGHEFTPLDEPAQWCDYGADFYAVQSWTAAPDGRHVWIGWMNSWGYARNAITEGWTGVMTVPRDVGIARTPKGYRLIQEPIGELANSRRELLRTDGLSLNPGDDPLTGIEGSAIDLVAQISLGGSSASQLRLAVRVGEDETTNIELDLQDLALAVDRYSSGRHLLHRSSPGSLVSIAGKGRTLDLRVLVDSTSVEVFAAGGMVAITQQILPDASSTGLSLRAVDGVVALESLEVYEITGAEGMP